MEISNLIIDELEKVKEELKDCKTLNQLGKSLPKALVLHMIANQYIIEELEKESANK